MSKKLLSHLCHSNTTSFQMRNEIFIKFIGRAMIQFNSMLVKTLSFDSGNFGLVVLPCSGFWSNFDFKRITNAKNLAFAIDQKLSCDPIWNTECKRTLIWLQVNWLMYGWMEYPVIQVNCKKMFQKYSAHTRFHTHDVLSMHVTSGYQGVIRAFWVKSSCAYEIAYAFCIVYIEMCNIS